jgi:hypothetical protein
VTRGRGGSAKRSTPPSKMFSLMVNAGSGHAQNPSQPQSARHGLRLRPSASWRILPLGWEGNMRIALALGIVMGATCIAVAEDYRLVHAIDDDETTIRTGLTKEECRQLKADFLESKVIVVQGSEDNPSSGSLTCLPEGDS